LTQAPLHDVKPLLHENVHPLFTHSGTAFATVVVHALPHVPQLFALIAVSTHVVPQSDGVAEGQPETHWDPTHTGVLPLHVFPHPLQLFLSEVMSTHAPLQSV
jgi:hypothetical protein